MYLSAPCLPDQRGKFYNLFVGETGKSCHHSRRRRRCFPAVFGYAMQRKALLTGVQKHFGFGQMLMLYQKVQSCVVAGHGNAGQRVQSPGKG